MRLDDLADLRVAVWGAGREGRAAIALLQRRYPGKALTLFANENEATEAAWTVGASAAKSEVVTNGSAAAACLSLNIVTMPPDAAALAAFDVVIKSPGISPYRAPYPEAERAGVRFTSGSALWFAEHRDARTICVTGTKGKSTVTALIAHLLRAGGRRVGLAGNIGLALLDLVDAGMPGGPPAPDWWVIELSSFQTRDFGGTPTVAVINNLLEEHLDWHGDIARYQADKLQILHAQSTLAVLNASDRSTEPQRLSGRPAVWFNSPRGWHVREDAVWRGDERVLPLATIPIPGLHNAQNLCAALAAIEAAGEDARALAPHVATFKPLPHRLQHLGARDGIDYVNDSISTTPYATIEALRSLGTRDVTVLVGGFDRGVSWQPFAAFVASHAPYAIVTMGANRESIRAALHADDARTYLLDSAPTLAGAFACARALARTGSVILMSPGAPSFDQFGDYAERGREFARLSGFDPLVIAQIEGLGIL